VSYDIHQSTMRIALSIA